MELESYIMEDKHASKSKKPKYTIKLIMIGDSFVGKTSLLYQFLNNDRLEDGSSTIGIEQGSKVIEVESEKVKLNVWDTAGTEAFSSIARSYYRSSAGVLLVFDLTRRITFDNVRNWIYDYLDNCSNDDPLMILVGNKSDLESDILISEEEAQNFAKEQGIPYFGVSAFTGSNIDQPFLEISSRVIQKCNSGNIDVRSRESGVFLTREFMKGDNYDLKSSYLAGKQRNENGGFLGYCGC